MLKKIFFIILLLHLVSHGEYKPVYSNQNKINYKIIINNVTGDDEIINIVIQINGKKRGLVQTKPNIIEEKLFEIVKNDEKVMKYLDQKNIKRKIYIKDKLLNIII